MELKSSRSIQQNAGELIDHLVETHHAFTRKEIERIAHRLLEAVNKYSDPYAFLKQLQETFAILASDLTAHLAKEEMGLFPYIKELEKAVGSSTVPALPHFVSVKHPIRMFMTEHDETDNILKRIRSITNNYQAPPEADTDLIELYNSLAGLDEDLREHMDLENHQLFILAAGLEELCIAQANASL